MKKTFFQKVCLAVVACFMSVMAFADANPFAYNVSAVATDGGYAVSYQLNAPAEAVNVLIVKDGETVATIPGTTAADALQTVNVPTAGLADGTYNFAIEVTGAAVETAAQFGPTHKFYAPYGCAIDNDPQSEYFGRILVAESNCGAKATGYNSAADAGVGTGLYAFTPKMEAILNAEGKQGFRGGVDFFNDGAKHNGSALTCKRVIITKDGRILVSSTTPGLNPLYEASKDLSTLTPIFVGTEADGQLTNEAGEYVASYNAAIAAIGEGANLHLVMINSNNVASVSVASFRTDDYALGTATTWSAAADSTFKALLPTAGTMCENQCNIVADEQGGIWFCNYRGTADMPSLRHINADGVVDFSETRNMLRQGGLAWTSTGLLAVPTNTKQVTVYEVINGEAGITLSQKYVITTTCNGDNACYFDYADNLYIVDSSSEVFVAFATPRENNTVVTPARAEFAFEVGGDGGKHIIFKESGTTSDNGTKQTTIEGIIAEGAEFVASIDAASDIYQARTGCGIKYGSSSKAGKLYMTLAEPAEFDSIVIVAAMYGDSEGTDGFTVNGVTFPLSAGNKVFEHCVLVPEGVVSNINIDQVKASKGRIYMTEIILYQKAGETPVDPQPAVEYYLAGNGTEGAAWCDGKNWAVDGTPLVNNTITYTALPAGVYQFKVTNGTWDAQWGYSNLADNTNIEDGGGNNVKFILCEPCDVTIAINPEANQITLTIVGTYGNCPIEITSMTIVGDPRMIPWAWEPAAVEGDMTKLADGSYTLTLTNVALQAGQNYQYKAAANHAWGVKELPASGDNILTVEADGNYDIVFTVNAELTELNAVATLAVEPPAPAAPEMNIYAFGLKGTLAEGMLNIEYSLNATATAAEVQILAGEEVVKTVALTELAKGAHTAAIDLTGLADGEYTWAVKAEAAATEVLTLINDPDELQYSYYLPMGLDVDYFPASPHFGNIYVSESSNGASDGHNATSQNKTLGIYVYDPLLQCASENALVGYAGGLTWSADAAGPRRIKVAEDGLLYVTDYGDANRGIYIMDPANPTADFVPVFAPYNAENPNYGNPGAIDVVGVGAERQIYTIDWDATLYCYRYDIGAENNSTVIPVDIYPGAAEEIKNGYNNIRFDGKGGFWFAQSRWDTNPYAPLGHVNAAGELDFAKRDFPFNNNASYRGQLGLNKDKTLLAFAGNKVASVFAITWNEEGVPALELLYATPEMGGNIDGVAFDYADNLYVVSASSERLYMYATPKVNNATVVPAAAPIVKGEPVVADPVYTKVADVAELNGTFVIVSEVDNKIWTAVDAANGNADVAIVGGAIAQEFAAYEVEIAPMEGGYSIKVLNGDNANKYIYGSGSGTSNGLKFSDDAKANLIEINEGVMKIYNAYDNGNVILAYNANANNCRFRFFKQATVESQANYNMATLYKKVGSGEVVVPPTPAIEAAPVPTYPAEKVTAIYSDAYTAMGYDFGEWNSGTAYNEVATTAENDMAAHFVTTGLGYFGLQIHGTVVATTTSELHLHIYPVGEMTSVRIVPITGAAENGVFADNLIAGQWNEVVIPMTAFGEINLANIYQIKFDNCADVEFYLDNIFVLETSTVVDEEAPVLVSAEVVEVTFNTVTIKANATDNSEVVTFTVMSGEEVVATQAAAQGVDANIVVKNLTPGTDYTLVVSVADAAGNQGGTTTLTATTMALPAPAPAPTVDASWVKSIYSDVYTPATALVIGSWSQSTVVTEMALAEGDNAYLCTNSNYLGWELNGNVAFADLTGYTLHMDVYVAEAATIEFTPVWGAEALKTFNLVAGWNSLEIVLATEFAGINEANIYQLKWANMPRTCWIDNVYFYKEVVLPEKLDMYTCAEAKEHYDLGVLVDDDVINIKGYIANMFLKDANFQRFGSVSIWLTDEEGGTAKEFELYNCYGIDGDTLASYALPEGVEVSDQSMDVVSVTDRNGITYKVGDYVEATGKMKKFNSTYELNTGCYITKVVPAGEGPDDPDQPEGLENATINNGVQKVFENGHIIIIKNGERYSVTGQKL